MTNGSPYRIAALTLVVIFAVFNIGLPIVVASCPMEKFAGSARCWMCVDEPLTNSLRLTTERDTSCCVTKFAADRNLTAFLHAQQTAEKVKLVVVVQPFDAFSVVDFSSHVAGFSLIQESPPPAKDIPILVSSLLI